MLGEEVKGEGMEEVRAWSPGQAGEGSGRQSPNKEQGEDGQDSGDATKVGSRTQRPRKSDLPKAI